MARNRKSQTAGLVAAPALKAAVICLVIVVCCVGYVWQKKKIADLSQQIRYGEKTLAQLHEKNDKLRKEYAGYLSPTAIEARARDLKLGLGVPRPEQILRLPEPTVDKPGANPKGARLMAGQTVAVPLESPQ